MYIDDRPWEWLTKEEQELAIKELLKGSLYDMDQKYDKLRKLDKLNFKDVKLTLKNGQTLIGYPSGTEPWINSEAEETNELCELFCVEKDGNELHYYIKENDIKDIEEL